MTEAILKSSLRQVQRRSRRLVQVVPLVALVLAGCATTRESAVPPEGQNLIDRQVLATTSGESSAERSSRAIGLSGEVGREDPILVRGTDRMVAQPRIRPGVSVSGAAVSLQFEQAPIVEVIHAVFGDVLGLPYVITQSVTGNVTIRTAKPLERDQVLPVMESLLAANGLAAVQDAAGVFHVGTAEALRDVAPALSLPGTRTAGQRVVVVPLQFVGAAEMAQILGPVAKQDSIVRVDGFRNLLLLSGTATQIDGWMEIVRLFDVDVLKGMSVGLFPLANISVKEAEAALSLLMSEVPGGGTAAGGAQAGAARANVNTASQPTSAATMPGAAGQQQANAISAPKTLGGPLAGLVRFIAIERLNAILVVTPRAHYLDQVRDWIARFDVRRDNLMESRLYVYPVQNGNAGHLASILSAVFGGKAQGQAGPVSSGVAPGLARGTTGTTGTTGLSTSTTGVTGSSGGTNVPDATSSGVQTAAVAAVQVGDNIRVVADEANNALLIYASGADYRKIEAALRDLDRAPTQILIEASIIEVTLNDTLKYGLQWFFQGGVGSDYTGEGMLNLNTSGDIAPAQPGFSYAITNPLGNVRAVLNALADKSLLKVISSPSVLVLDNQTAKIHVGNQQPIRSSTSISDAGRETFSIEYKDTGVQLSVTPSANAGGMVSMDVSQVVTDVGSLDAATGQRSFLQRFVSSKIAARSGETVVLGGLIRDNDSGGRQGLPLLHDVPVLGNLFGATSNTRNRTELLVTLTPRVLETEADLRGIGEELRRKMAGVGAVLASPVGQVGDDDAVRRGMLQ